MKKTGIIILSLVLAASCIKNDLSYPRIVADITSFAVEGQKSADINTGIREVSVVLEETADIKSLPLLDFTYTEGAELLDSLPPVLDLTSPLTLTLRTYQDYVWKVSAVQPIERYVIVRNQIGDSNIDVDSRMIYVYVPEDQSLSNIVIEDMKLEPEGSVVLSTTGTGTVASEEVTVTEEVRLPMTLDCTLIRYFDVEYKNDTIRWSMKVLPKQIDLEISSVNAWCYSADVQAVSKTGISPVIEYKASSASSWTVAENVSLDGRNVTASLARLKADTQYSVRIIDGDLVSEEVSFKTGSPVQLDNMNFDKWHMQNSVTWYPFEEGASKPVWGTANPGTNFGNNPVNPTRPEYDHVVTAGGAAVRMESVVALGMFAAGNIFTGEFVDITMSGGVSANLLWGAPFTARPYSLKGWYDYSPKIVDKAPEAVPGLSGKNPYADQMGKPDHCQILAVLIAEAESADDKGPFKVSSAKPGVPDLKNDPRVIAFGTIESDADTAGEYVEFECVLEYKDDRTPAYVIVVACSSLYGNFFTGAVGSVMYADDFEFIYK